MQRQAVLTVRLVLDDEQTLDEAEEIVTDALTEAQLMAHVKGMRVEKVSKTGVQIEK